MSDQATISSKPTERFASPLVVRSDLRREPPTAGRLQRSIHLRVLTSRAREGAFVYHSLFGNVYFASLETLAVLDSFALPACRDAVIANGQRPELVEETIDRFVSAFFLVPENTDERSLTEIELREREMLLRHGQLVEAVQLSISEGCNLRCVYCFADRVDERSSGTDLRGRTDYKTMSLETAIRAVDAASDAAARNGRSGLVVKFFGREPLLNWPVINELVDYYEVGHIGLRHVYTITTNGTLFTPEVIEKFKRYNVTVIVSLDGPLEANLLRVTHKGEETFSAVDAGLQLLQEHDLRCSIASVLSEHNFEALDTLFIDYLADRRIMGWEIKLSMQGDAMSRYSAADYAQKLFDLYSYGRERGIAVTGDWYDPLVTLFHTTRRADDVRTHRLAPSSCSASDHQFNVEPNGSVYPCRAMQMKLGDIDDLDAIFESEKYRHLTMRTYHNVPACRGCKLEGFCQGVCLGHSESKYKDIYHPDDAYCEIYRAFFDLLLAHWVDEDGALKEGTFTHC